MRPSQPVVPEETSPHAGPLPAEVRAFYACFNRGRYFEAHEVLEGLWLRVRGRLEARCYQGLIQLAGAFVHLEKGRRAPALALLRRSQEHLAAYPEEFQGLDLPRLRDQIAAWHDVTRAGGNPCFALLPPRLVPPLPGA